MQRIPGVQQVPFSGAVRSRGTQDGTSENLLVQVKSTGTNSITVTYEMLLSLLKDKTSIQLPVLVLDFCSPHIGQAVLPETQWAAVPLEVLVNLLGDKDE